MELVLAEGVKIPKQMKAVVLEKAGSLKQKTIDVWDLSKYDSNSDMILLKVKACGVCGSDYRYYKGENPWSQHTLGYHIPNKPNIVLGHEFAGEVVGVVSEKNKKWLGKRVVPICSQVCHKCYLCKTGREHLCPETIHLGHGQGWGDQKHFPGAYAEYVVAWKGGSVLCIGAGPAGNGIAQVARIKGADQIMIIEKSQIAIEVAKKNGFKHIFDGNKMSDEEIQAAVMKLTNNHGCVCVYDSVGSKKTMELGLNVLDKGGCLVNMAVHDLKVDFNAMKLSGEKKITTSSNFELKDYQETLKWLGEGKFNVKPWLKTVKLSEIPDIFKKIVDEKQRGYFKVEINNFEE